MIHLRNGDVKAATNNEDCARMLEQQGFRRLVGWQLVWVTVKGIVGAVMRQYAIPLATALGLAYWYIGDAHRISRTEYFSTLIVMVFVALMVESIWEK